MFMQPLAFVILLDSMIRVRPLRAALLFVVIGVMAGQEAVKPGSMTIEDVIKLVQADVSDDLIIARVKRNAKAFDLNSDEIVALRKAGVSDQVIKYLLDPSQPYAPAPPPAPAARSASKAPPADPLVAKLPPEPGIYYLKPPDQFVALDPKTVVPYKQPGKMTKLSGGLVKGHVIGAVVGPSAQMRLKTGRVTFYARLGEKMAIEDLTLLTTEPEKDRRNLDFGTKAGQTNFPVKSVQQVESKEVSPGVFRMTATLEKPGEYFFFVRGSGDPKKGTLGKGYDLGVD